MEKKVLPDPTVTTPDPSPGYPEDPIQDPEPCPISCQNKLNLLAISVLLAITFGFIYPRAADRLATFREIGFHFLFFTFFLWVSTFRFGMISWEWFREFVSRHGFPVLIAGALTVCAFRASSPQFRILADEVNLLGISMSMYDEREFKNPTARTYYYEGVSRAYSNEWDIRPNGYPFCVFLAHSLLGYSPENSFRVNGVAFFLGLCFFYHLLFRWFGRFWGIIGMLFLAAFPVGILSATSGGFETVNQLFIILSFWGLDRVMRSGKVEDAEFLGITLVILAQIRYESILYTLCLLPLALAFLSSGELRNPGWRSILLPLLYLPAVWQRLGMTDPRAYQVYDGAAVFSLGYLLQHLNPALSFFLSSKVSYGMIPGQFLLFLVGFSGMILARLFGRGKADGEPGHGPALVTGGAACFAIYTCILLSYNMGDLTHQWTNRLGVAYLPFLVPPGIWLLSRFPWLAGRGRPAMVAVALGMIFYYWPVAGANSGAREIIRFREFLQCRRFLEREFPAHDVVVISESANLFVPFRWSSLNFFQFAENVEELKRNLHCGLFQGLIVLQKLGISDDKPSADTIVPEGFAVETLYKTQLTGDQYLRIGRLKPVRVEEFEDIEFD